MQPSDPYGLVGQVLDGQFRVDQPVGEGGFSVVYRGRHLGLGEPIAIKCLKLPPRLGSAIVESFIRRFRDESKIQYKLSQSSLHIARTIAAGTAMAPSVNALVPFMVLEWLEGYPLAEELRARRERGESGRPLESALRLLDPVAEALAIAHGMGVVHRDLNPSNIFLALDAAGGNLRPKVVDFGVAKVVSDHALALGPRTATLNQLRLFTPPYGAPEQFDDRVGPIGTAADVYSFALVMVELLTDRPPNEGEHLMDLMTQACDPAKRPTPRARGAAVSDAVEEVFARALAVDPARRPVDVGEFWGNLKHAAASGPGPRPAGSHTAKGTFILNESPFSAAPTTPPAFDLALSKPAQGSAPPPAAAPALTASWHSPPVLPPLNDADTWHSPAAAPPAPRPPARGDTQGDWGGPPTVLDRPARPAPARHTPAHHAPAHHAPAHHAPAHHAPAHHAPAHHAAAISPLAETGPAGEPTSHVDPFGPTVEGAAEARPGASPLSITVKPGEKRPEFLMPAARAPNARAPGATPPSGLPLTVPDRKPAHTPDGGVARPAPYPPSPAGQAPPEHSNSYPPAGGGQPYAAMQAAPGGQGYAPAQAAGGQGYASAQGGGGQGYAPAQGAPGGQGYASAQAAPGGQGYASAQAAPGGQGYTSPPAGGGQGYASPPAGGGQSYAPSPNGGNHAYGASPPGGSQSHGALPAAGHLYGPPPTPQGSRSSRPAPEPMTGYGLPAGQAPLRALEGSGGMVPMPATPSQLPSEPAAQPKVGSALKPMLAWSLVVLALAAALGGVVYLIVLYVRRP